MKHGTAEPGLIMSFALRRSMLVAELPAPAPSKTNITCKVRESLHSENAHTLVAGWSPINLLALTRFLAEQRVRSNIVRE